MPIESSNGDSASCLAVLPDHLDVDHIRAKTKGGSDNAENKQLLCPNCNRRRQDKLSKEFIAERLAGGNEWTDYVPDES